jgi:hypothetical protein
MVAADDDLVFALAGQRDRDVRERQAFDAIQPRVLHGIQSHRGQLIADVVDPVRPADSTRVPWSVGHEYRHVSQRVLSQIGGCPHGRDWRDHVWVRARASEEEQGHADREHEAVKRHFFFG